MKKIRGLLQKNWPNGVRFDRKGESTIDIGRNPQKLCNDVIDVIVIAYGDNCDL